MIAIQAIWVLVAILALAGLSLLAYALQALDAVGAAGSFLVGLGVSWAGGLGWLLLMVCFTVLGVLATRFRFARKTELRLAEPGGGERGIRNVLGNGLAAFLCALAAAVVGPGAARLAFATAVAAVTADTLASEIGVLSARARSIMPPFAVAARGTNGAVSWAGQAAAFVGAGAIAGASHYLVAVPWAWIWVPWAGGWFGCQVDSLLGATIEREPGASGTRRRAFLSKQAVNFLGAAVPALVVLVAMHVG